MIENLLTELCQHEIVCPTKTGRRLRLRRIGQPASMRHWHCPEPPSTSCLASRRRRGPTPLAVFLISIQLPSEICDYFVFYVPIIYLMRLIFIDSYDVGSENYCLWIAWCSRHRSWRSHILCKEMLWIFETIWKIYRDIDLTFLATITCGDTTHLPHYAYQLIWRFHMSCSILYV